MRPWCRSTHGRGVLPVALSASCVVGIALLAGGCGGGSKAKLSENSHQTAYAAGLGARRVATVPVAPPRAATAVRCVAAASTVASSSVAYAALVQKKAVVRLTLKAARESSGTSNWST